MRERICSRGKNSLGHQIWSPEDDELCRRHYPDYAILRGALPNRTFCAIKNRCRALGIVHKRKPWSAAERAKLRKLYPMADWPTLMEAVPSRTKIALHSIAKYNGYHRQRRPCKLTGIWIIDEIRRRCLKLNLTMTDLDKMARTGGYFTRQGWNSHFSHKAIGKAIIALDGEISVQWSSTE